ncbi:DNA polymerase epsilon catalytic subunit [Serendipita sp. 399]|nr:DNA polymerase epsilon catalytic subunit [Serendipita sp. 399]
MQPIFGLVPQNRGRGRGGFRGGSRGWNRGGFRGSSRGRGRGGGSTSGAEKAPVPARGDDGTHIEERFESVKVYDEIDEKLGFARIEEGGKRDGWLVNMHPTTVRSEDWPSGRAAVDYYFIQDDGGMFKSRKTGFENTIEEWLMKKYEGALLKIVRERKEDLRMASLQSYPNHLLSPPRLFMRLVFRNVTDLLTVRRDIMPLALANSAKMNAIDAYAEVIKAEAASTRIVVNGEDAPSAAWSMDVDSISETKKGSGDRDPREGIIDIREFDVPYYLRVAIDNDIRVGLWYTVTIEAGQPTLSRITDRVKRAEPVVMAYDIETTKAPLKFPDQAVDQVMMISYMIDAQGYLIVNRDIVSEDIDDFEYTPKEGYEGPFTTFNEADEEATIRRFFEHIQTAKPTVMATFNGDSFDFPFLAARAQVHGIDMFLETGFARDSENEFKSRNCIHMDCFRWVKRDSYLPQGSQGLKAVTKAKLGYNPVELDPELMTPYALERPQELAQYSVSDAVATYYLYMKYVHPFIFSLCNIIPLRPDEVLRKGSGTLCETLLMVEAYAAHIIMPNRHEDDFGNMFEGHLLASETYVGGHVEALEAGVFRSDIPTHFKLVPETVQKLIDDLDRALEFCIATESGLNLTRDQVSNYQEIKDKIQSALEQMRDNPVRSDKPLIYHLDVAAMYPNIMLSNRLQPDSMIDESVCAVCDFNTEDKQCARKMEWAWRGEFFPAQRDELNMVKHALHQESFPPKFPNGPKRKFTDLTPTEQTALIHKRLGDYSKKVYKKIKDTRVITRESIICQRENPFYIDTVRSFRDRRYEYKGLHKTWKKNLDAALASGGLAEIEEAKKMIVLYDSLQLAHKCILNSFYGYVMRKGARWHSMEMAGITCLTGAKIIQMARKLVDGIGRPLELDTDGIWCMLPGIFPENFTFKLSTGKTLFFSYPCTMLNHLVHAGFTNHQYHTLKDGRYEVRSENSIFFELDGPYKAMILPSSKEEDKLLKKRYAVFNDDGSLAELKGFEVKRRGELQLIKIFQSQIFEKFLLGTTTEECYAAVARVADQWLDVLFTKASTLDDEELVELIAENRSMSKTLQEYGAQKSTSISTAKRLAEFLGDQMVKDKGLACKFIISAKPHGAPVTERAVPVAIFSAAESVKRVYLRKWLKDNSLTSFDLRSILDWEYYIERLGSVIQKLITIPAAMQGVSNPVPRIRHPDWLSRRVATAQDRFQQHKLTSFFKVAPRPAAPMTADDEDDGSDDGSNDGHITGDIEDLGSQRKSSKSKIAVVNRKVPENKNLGVPAQKKPLPNPSTNYSAWLRAIRPIWKAERTSRLQASGASNLPAIFRGIQQPIARSTCWDVIQIRPTPRDGRFMLWLGTETDVVQVVLRIKRQFYINLKTPAIHGGSHATFQSEYLSEKVSKVLPRGHPSLHLYKITVSEDIYKSNVGHFAHLMNNPQTDGVYETQLPLAMRALLELGSSCSIQPGQEITLSRARDTGFDLHQLEKSPQSLRKKAYLDGGLAMKSISRELGLAEYKSKILVLSSRKDFSYYERGIAAISNIPVLRMTLNQQASLDRLDWQRAAVQGLLGHYFAFGEWLRDTIDNSVYYDVPIGNIPADHSLFFMDVAFARRLIKQGMVLWWSPGTKPDLGGREADGSAGALAEEVISPETSRPGLYTNVCLLIEMRNLAVDAVLQSSLINELEGSGGTTSFDSISHTLQEYANGDAHASVTLGDSVLSPQVFFILKGLVKGWMLDKASGADSPAELAIAFFWRWVSSPSAQMYDLGMHRFVHGLMVKTFFQVQAEFKRLGSTVIYADLGQILLLTSKPPGSAAAYATYITTAVTSNELFKHLYLHTERYYDILLYLDSANQGGIVCLDPRRKEPSPVPCMANTWNIQAFLPPAIQPLFHQEVSRFLVELYRIRMKHISSTKTPVRVLDANYTTGVQPDERFAQEQDEIKSYISRRLTRRLLPIVNKIVQEQRRAMMGEEPELDYVFPVLPGSYLSFTNPALEFVKSICEVFGLAREYHIEITLLRRTLLDIVGVREFAEEATWRQPCQSFKLSMVICHYCNQMRDFDFCRDVDLLPKAQGSNNNAAADEGGGRTTTATTTRSAYRWTCASCDTEYDRRAIERSMIDVVKRMELAFQVQDLRCSKCKRIKADNLSLHCTCSGPVMWTVAKADNRRKLRTIVNVASVHNLAMLKSYAEQVLEAW